ncbi:uncharacterized protein LOC111019539 [Momordica charantia]|uniref:Uncharacterized protein LOC111019539 n=1 Tax=Momordica charantia TaxID=3673 RepID=A0A6J1DCR4_MOMCH|nr:uncharacterized protein LOC111019539 [Momordica charantia]
MLNSGLSGSRSTAYDNQKKDGGKGLVIQEISSDEEREEDDGLMGQRQDKNQMNSGSGKAPSVEHPDDTSDERQIVTHRSSEDSSFGVQPKASKSSMHTCKVTFGGVDGAYYTSTRTRTTDNEGVLLEETKEADKTTGQAIHRISRGIHDKGHSVTRKLNSDGKVDTLQTLHNLNEEVLAGFDRAWKGNFQGHKHVPRGGFHTDGNAESNGSRNREMSSWDFPSFGGSRHEHDGSRHISGAGTTKKVVRINID